MKRHLFKAMLLSSIAGMAATGAMAQDAPATDTPAEGEIVVTGIRASLEKSQALKQDSTSVVEVVTAEDIGKLPQVSIADSLGRLAGLAGERRAGRVSGISVRGFREDFVGTSLNGRELIGIGDNRGVEYDLYPSEIVSNAVVYKTPEADLSVMGIGGTVDIRTVRPLEQRRTLTANGSFETNGQKSNNPDFKDTGHRLALSFSDKFADDTIGIALTAATTSSPTQEQYSSVWGWDKGSIEADGKDNRRINKGPDAGKYVVSGGETASKSSVLKRDTLAGVLQYAPSETLTVSFDGLYIKFSDQGISRGFIEALGTKDDGSGVKSSNATAVTSATTPGFNSVMRSDPRDKTGKLTVFGTNLHFTPSDKVEMNLDVSRAKSSKSDTRGESYSGLGRAGLKSQGPNNIRTWTYTDNGLHFSGNSQRFDNYDTMKLAGPQSWGGSMASIAELSSPEAKAAGVGFAQAQDGFVNTALFDETLTAARLETILKLDGNFLKTITLGMRVSDHKKSKTNQGFFLTAETYPLDGAIPEDARRGVASLNWAGMGNVIAYDAIGLINSDFYTKYAAAELEPDRMGDTYTIKETLWQPSIKATFDSDMGGVRLFGNAGVQGVITRQEGNGYNSLVAANLRVQAKPISDHENYTKFLPSANLNLDLGKGHTIRLSAAKVISRPRIDYLNPGSRVKFDNNVANVTNTNPSLGPWNSRSGSAKLRPYEADQADLSYEFYFAPDGFISVTGFYKDLKNWNVSTTTVVDYTQFYIPGFHKGVSSDGLTTYTPATFKGVNTTYTGGLKGSAKGVEVQASIPFGHFVDALEGLGVIGGASFTKGKLDNGSAIPGQSKRVYQATAYYERGGFSIRGSVNKRSAWLSEDRGGSNSIDAVNRSGQTLVDAQFGYDFKDSGLPFLSGLRMSLQGQNLTNERDVYIDSGSGLNTKVQTFGRNFMLNLTYSFF